MDHPKLDPSFLPVCFLRFLLFLLSLAMHAVPGTYQSSFSFGW